MRIPTRLSNISSLFRRRKAGISRGSEVMATVGGSEHSETNTMPPGINRKSEGLEPSNSDQATLASPARIEGRKHNKLISSLTKKFGKIGTKGSTGRNGTLEDKSALQIKPSTDNKGQAAPKNANDGAIKQQLAGNREEDCEYLTSEKATSRSKSIEQEKLVDPDATLAELVGELQINDPTVSSGSPEKGEFIQLQLPCVHGSKILSSQTADGSIEPPLAHGSPNDVSTLKAKDKAPYSGETSTHPENSDQVAPPSTNNNVGHYQGISVSSASQPGQSHEATAIPVPGYKPSHLLEPESDDVDATSWSDSTASDDEVLTPEMAVVELPSPIGKRHDSRINRLGYVFRGARDFSNRTEGEPAGVARVRPSVDTNEIDRNSAEDGKAILPTPADKGKDDIRYYFRTPSDDVHFLDDYLNVYTDDGTVIYDHSCNSNSGDLLTPSFWIHTTPYWIDQSGLVSQNAGGTLYNVELLLCEPQGRASEESEALLCDAATFQLELGSSPNDASGGLMTAESYNARTMPIKQRGATMARNIAKKHKAMEAHELHHPIYNKVQRGGASSLSLRHEKHGNVKAHQILTSKHNRGLTGKSIMKREPGYRNSPLVSFLLPSRAVVASPGEELSEVDGDSQLSTAEWDAATPLVDSGDLSPQNLRLDGLVPVEPLTETEADLLWSNLNLPSQAAIGGSQHSEISGKPFPARNSATPSLSTKPSVGKNCSFYAAGKLYYFDNERRLYSEDGTLTYDGSNSTLTKQPLHPNFSIDGTPYWLLLDGLFSRDATDKQYCVLAWSKEPSADNLGDVRSQPSTSQNGTVAPRSSSSPGYCHDLKLVPAISFTPDEFYPVPDSRVENGVPDVHLNPLENSLRGGWLMFSPSISPGISPDFPDIRSPLVNRTMSSGQSLETLPLFQMSEPGYIQNTPAAFVQRCTIKPQKAPATLRQDSKRGKKQPLICPICKTGKIWRRPVALEEHIRTHTGEKPFACPFKGCKAAHATKPNMKRHFQTHRVGELEHYRPDETESEEEAPTITAAYNPYNTNRTRKFPAIVSTLA